MGSREENNLGFGRIDRKKVLGHPRLDGDQAARNVRSKVSSERGGEEEEHLSVVGK